jgi:hypothetical protein
MKGNACGNEAERRYSMNPKELNCSEQSIIAEEERMINKEVKMWNSKARLRDKYRYPVVFIIGKPITNIIRALLHTNVKQTIKRFNSK